jgi:hypothetical protein
MLKKILCAMHKKSFSQHSKEILCGYVELCTNKKEKILQPRIGLSFTLHKNTSCNVTENLSPKHKTNNTQPTESLTVKSWWS